MSTPLAAPTYHGIGELRGRIRAYLVDNLLLGEDELDDGASLLDAGFLDSTGAVELVAFLEATFGILVADRELVPENLDSVERIAAFVARKLTEA